MSLAPDIGLHEQRSEPRNRVVLNALLAWGPDHAFTPDCIIRNLTAHGAAVRIAESERLPSDLVLIELKAARAHAARVVWRRGGFAGLQFKGSRDLRDARPTDPHRILWLDRQARPLSSAR